MRFASRKTIAFLLIAGTCHLAGCARVSEFVAEHKPVARGDKFTTQMSIGKLHEQKGQLTRARDFYLDLHRSTRGEERAAVSHRLGIVYGRLEDIPAAKQAFEEALAATTTQKPRVLNDYGYLLYLEGEYAAAEKILREAAAADPNDKKIANNLALVLGKQGRMDESYALFRETVGEARANANVGYLHAVRGEGPLATQRYSRALSLDGDLKSAANALAQIADMKQQADSIRTAKVPARAPETLLAAAEDKPAVTPQPALAAIQPAAAASEAAPKQDDQIVLASATRTDASAIIEAIRGLEHRQIDADATAAELLPLLNHANDYVRLYAARALLKIERNTDSAVSTLLVAMTNPQPEVRAFAANFFQEVEPKSEEVVTALNDALYDTDVFVRLYAANAIGSSEASIAVLIESLSHADQRARWLATLALADFAPQQATAVNALGRALADQDAQVRGGAALALGRIGQAALPALSHLEAAKDDSSPEVQAAVREAIQKIQP